MDAYTLHRTKEISTEHDLRACVHHYTKLLNFRFDVYCIYEQRFTDGETESLQYALVHTDAEFPSNVTIEEIKQVFLEESQTIHSVLDGFPSIDHFYVMGYFRQDDRNGFLGACLSNKPEFL